MSRCDQVTEASKFGWADARDPLEVVDAKERSVPISLRHNRCGRRWAHAREGLEKTGIDTADTVSRSTPNQPSQARTRSTTGCTGAGRATTSSRTSSTRVQHAERTRSRCACDGRKSVGPVLTARDAPGAWAPGFCHFSITLGRQINDTGPTQYRRIVS